MKLRRNTLEPLRFDPSGAYIENISEHGVSKADVQNLAKQLEVIRDAMIGPELETLASHSAFPDLMQPSDVGFYTLPGRLLAECESDRKGSELGRLFKVANRMHAAVDRVVVLGIGGSSLGARVLLDGCCQPIWNELSRGARGSKPRMYFDGDSFDNDATQGLLHLLGDNEGKIATSEAEQWGLVVISKSGETLETSACFRVFLNALERSCGNDPSKVSELLVPVTSSGGTLHTIANELGCKDIFPVPDGIEGQCSVLSSVGLVPAAMLGINVIELLQGAVAMNEHFAKKPAEENIILQFVAVNHLLNMQRGVNIRVMSLWSKALESFGYWYDHLCAASLGKDERGFMPITTIHPRDTHSRHSQHLQGKRDKVFNNILVDQCRFDNLVVNRRLSDSDSLDAISGKTLPELMRTSARATNESLASEGRPTTNLFLPRVDEHHLGQLFQMMMIATTLESRLIGVNRYSQSGVESYKKNLNRLVGCMPPASST